MSYKPYKLTHSFLNIKFPYRFPHLLMPTALSTTDESISRGNSEGSMNVTRTNAFVLTIRGMKGRNSTNFVHNQSRKPGTRAIKIPATTLRHKAQPTGAVLVTKPIDRFDKLVLTCENDKGVGVHGENHKHIGQKRPFSVESESFGMNKKVTLENLHETNNDHEVTSSKMQIVQEPRDKRLRQSTTVHEKTYKESPAAYQKRHRKVPVSEDRVWKLLEELQVDKYLFTRTYLFLLENPDKIRALRGCPKHRQKNFLTEIMFKQSR